MDTASRDERYRGRELVWKAEANRSVAEEVAPLEPSGRAVDLAAGEGRNAVRLAERGREADAVDFSAVALEKAEGPAADRGVRLRTVHADLTHWGPAEATYGLALMAYLHLPWPEMARGLPPAVTAVRSGGTLLLVGHHAANPQRGYGGPQDPRVLYTAEQVADLWRPSTRSSTPYGDDTGRRSSGPCTGLGRQVPVGELDAAQASSSARRAYRSPGLPCSVDASPWVKQSTPVGTACSANRAGRPHAPHLVQRPGHPDGHLRCR